MTNEEKNALISAIEDAIALNKLLKISVDAFEEGSVSTRCPLEDIHKNHNGTMHAGVQFSVAEFAAGLTALSGMMDVVSKAFFVVSHGTVDFVATAKHAVVAKPQTETPIDFASAKESILAGETVEIEVPIDVIDEVTERLCTQACFKVVFKPIKQ